MAHSELLDILWIVLCTGLVLVMQGGFLCLETGVTRSKNSINVAFKNVTDLVVTLIVFWAVGYGLMFGTSVGGWFGSDRFAVKDTPGAFLTAFFLFQSMFCATMVTIVSGAVAERMRFICYVIVSAVLAGLVYPLFGHWAWNGLDGEAGGWLARAGFVDWAGSTVVHATGGWAALALLIIIGPRLGRFENGKVNEVSGSNYPLVSLGVILLWFGWLGFNAGSTLSLTEEIALIMLNTSLAAAAGAGAVMVTNYTIYGRAEYLPSLNGLLAGLVSITAAAHAVTMGQALAIGVAGGVLSQSTHLMLLSKKIDDAVGAVPVHLVPGIWGTLAVALFGDPEILGTGLGLGEQFLIQLQGVLAAAVVAFLIPLAIFYGISRIWRLRVSAQDEQTGLNVTEHGARTEIFDFVTALEKQARDGDITHRVPGDDFTEIGQIGTYYNRVMDSLQAAVAQTETIVRNANDAILLVCPETGRIRFHNPVAGRLFAYPCQALDTLPVLTLLPGLQLKHVVFDVLTEGTGQRSDGHQFPVEYTFSQAGDGPENLLIGVIRDITERKETEETVWHHANYDLITDLPNRRLFGDRLEQALAKTERHGQRVALFFLDLDRFKEVNDVLGHDTGDEVLRQTGRRLKRAVRKTDTVARLGGDEFTVIIEDFAAAEDLSKVANAILTEFAAPFDLAGQQTRLTTSIGIAVAPEDGLNTDDLLRAADSALYYAKEKGRNNYQFFTEKLRQRLTRRGEIETRIRLGLDKEQFVLYYQPQIDSRTNAVVGLEALIRWRQTDGTLLLPDDFIRLAEDTGLIVPLGQKVIERVARDISAWEALGFTAQKVSFNAAAKQFSQRHNLAEAVADVFGRAGISLKRLAVEITETDLMVNQDTMLSQLQRMNEMGMTVILDDFGKGYSSLSRLKDLPVQTLKLDKDFVDGLPDAPEDVAMVGTIVNLGRGLQISLIAEGVEQQDQMECLRRLGCHIIQGFYYARPMPADQVVSFVTSRDVT